MQNFFSAAVDNIYKHGDTDIFPFPIENRIIYDQKNDFVNYLVDIYKDFQDEFVQNSSNDIRSLVAVHHSGFRWASQLDPVWNAFLLGCVLSIAERIEDNRLKTDIVFGNYPAEIRSGSKQEHVLVSAGRRRRRIAA